MKKYKGLMLDQSAFGRAFEGDSMLGNTPSSHSSEPEAVGSGAPLW